MIQQATAPTIELGPWFVLWTESRAERKVEQRIGALGLHTWLPIVKEQRKWSDRWKEVEVPLFSGYLFARAEQANWHQILRTPGVLTVVKENGKPARLDNSFVRMLRDAIEREGAQVEAVQDYEDFEQGDEVVVQEGALAGVRGVVREVRSRRQLVLWVAQIGRGVALTIGTALVRRVHGP